MNRFSWYTVNRDGTQTQRYNPDFTENTPDAYNTAEIHFLPSPDALKKGIKTFSLFLKKNQKLIYKKRRHIDSSGGTQTEDIESVVYIVGYEEEFENGYFSSYCALLPDGRVEFSSDFNHITCHERNLDVEPLKLYESWPVV